MHHVRDCFFTNLHHWHFSIANFCFFCFHLNGNFRFIKKQYVFNVSYLFRLFNFTRPFFFSFFALYFINKVLWVNIISSKEWDPYTWHLNVYKIENVSLRVMETVHATIIVQQRARNSNDIRPGYCLPTIYVHMRSGWESETGVRRNGRVIFRGLWNTLVK